MDFSGKTVIVTGAGGGIGEGYARACADAGMNVVIAELSEEGGKRVAADVNAGGGTALFVQTDVGSEESARACAEATMEAFGAIHVCCNYAGVGNAIKTVGKDGPFPLDKFKLIIDINLIGTFNVLRLAAAEMQKNEPHNEYGGRGCIINTPSVAAYEGKIGQAP